MADTGMARHGMDITRGCVNLQLLMQRICHPPAYCEVSNEHIKLTPTFYKGTNSLASKLYNLNRYLVTLFSIFSVIRLAKIFNHWREGNNPEEICVYTLILAICNLGLSALNSLRLYTGEMCISEENALKLMKFRMTGYPSLRRIPSLTESLIYIVLGGFLPLIACCAVISPFFLNFLPLRLLAVRLFEEIGLSVDWYYNLILDLASGILYGYYIIHGGGNLLFLLLGCTAFCEAMQNLSSQLFKRATTMAQMTSLKIKVKNDTLQVVENRREAVGQNILSFCQCLKLYRIMQILIRMGNQAASEFLQVLLTMGVLLAGSGGYAFIKLYYHLPVLLYLGISFFPPLCLIVNFVLISLAAVPSKNGIRFKHFWRDKLMKKVNRLQLQSCLSIGYSFGFVANCTKQTALSIADVILNLVATLTLIRPN